MKIDPRVSGQGPPFSAQERKRRSGWRRINARMTLQQQQVLDLAARLGVDPHEIESAIRFALGWTAMVWGGAEPAIDAHLRAIARGQGLEYSPLTSARRNWSQQRWDSELQRSDAIPNFLCSVARPEFDESDRQEVAQLLGIPRLPDIPMLSIYHSRWSSTSNPLYVWGAVSFCAETKCAFPDWVTDYLVDCAARMPPVGAEGADMRKILPSALGFPAKRGPKKLAVPRDELAIVERLFLANVFAYAIGQGCSPARAAVEAASPLGPDYADRDERTLQTLVADYFGFLEVPQSGAAWQRALLVANVRPESTHSYLVNIVWSAP
jgi:hypothetical protein